MRRITIAGLRGRVSRAKASARTRVELVQEGWKRRGPRAQVDFERWVGRRLERASGYPDSWRVEVTPPERPARVAVLVHAFYPELVDELVGQLAHIPVAFDLIVTNATGAALDVKTAPIEKLRSTLVLEVENRGRDIWPMVQVVNAGLLDPYEIVLKVHTKRSDWREEHETLSGTGEQWRTSLMDSLLGSAENVQQVLTAFAADPSLGVITGVDTVKGPEHWGGDLELTRELLRRIELSLDPDSLRFAAGSFYWCRAFVLQGLRSLMMTEDDFEDEQGHIDGTTAHAVERAIGLLTVEAGLRTAGRDELPRFDGSDWRIYRRDAERTRRARLLPFYLPQFHATPENDRWWGKGFTEWANVTAARPVFLGHNQPNLPSDLGFYDLRLDEVRQAQMELASAHGIEGFMYYYYWFAGQRLLSMPIEKLANNPDVHKPFCIMWANENWTRRWDGRSSDILMGQDYLRAPAEQFIDDVLPFLKDPRYIRVDGRPVLAVYRIAQIPEYPKVIKAWRARAMDQGAGDLMVLSVDVAHDFDGLAGFDAADGIDGLLGFPPHNHRWEWVSQGRLGVSKRFKGNLLSYPAMVSEAERVLRAQDDNHYPGVMVTFDNTARRQWASDTWYGSNPYTFRRWLAAACASVAHRDPDRRIVFVNAWNEWAEGAVLEPSRRFGRTYLLAVRDVVIS